MIPRKLEKQTVWAFLAFCLIIALEILSLINPFGMSYAAYGKGLNFLNDNAATTWFCTFFQPHVADISFYILYEYKDIGFVMAVIGLLGLGAISKKRSKKQTIDAHEKDLTIALDQHGVHRSGFLVLQFGEGQNF